MKGLVDHSIVLSRVQSVALSPYQTELHSQHLEISHCSCFFFPFYFYTTACSLLLYLIFYVS